MLKILEVRHILMQKPLGRLITLKVLMEYEALDFNNIDNEKF